MIVAAIIVLAGVVISAVVSVFTGMPSFDLGMMSTTFGYILPYLRQGILFMNTFCYSSVIQVLLAITVAVEALVIDYKLVMWVATKIPMFGVSSD